MLFCVVLSSLRSASSSFVLVPVYALRPSVPSITITRSGRGFHSENSAAPVKNPRHPAKGPRDIGDCVLVRLLSLVKIRHVQFIVSRVFGAFSVALVLAFSALLLPQRATPSCLLRAERAVR
mgnify:CR=1 FL=1